MASNISQITEQDVATLPNEAWILPANIMDLQPTLTLKPIRGLTFVLSWNFLWKHQKEDAAYTPSPPLTVIPETIGIGRYIGNQIKLEGQPAMGSPRCRAHFRVGSTDASFLMTSLAFR